VIRFFSPLNSNISAPVAEYIKVCGSEKFDYDYRRKIFDRNGYRVIFLYLYKEKDKWKTNTPEATQRRSLC
jgi:hypothetical protein